jgi:hypothetical protein
LLSKAIPNYCFKVQADSGTCWSKSPLKPFQGKISDHQRHVNFALKKAAKMVNKNNRTYLVNSTMQEELMFLAEALKPDSGIIFKTPIAHLIPRIPTASIVGEGIVLCSHAGILSCIKVLVAFLLSRKRGGKDSLAPKRQLGQGFHLHELPQVFHNHRKLLHILGRLCNPQG